MPTRESSPKTGEPVNYPFRPWVRRVCMRAMVWGIGVLAALTAVVWVLRDPNEGHVGKAFTVLAGYAVLFLASDAASFISGQVVNINGGAVS